MGTYPSEQLKVPYDHYMASIYHCCRRNIFPMTTPKHIKATPGNIYFQVVDLVTRYIALVSRYIDLFISIY